MTKDELAQLSNSELEGVLESATQDVALLTLELYSARHQLLEPALDECRRRLKDAGDLLVVGPTNKGTSYVAVWRLGRADTVERRIKKVSS